MVIRARAGAAEHLHEATEPGLIGAPDTGDIVRRIASVVGEIDALKRERHMTPAFGARAKLAAAYFRKRPAQAQADA